MIILNLIVVLIAFICIISVTWKFIKENRVHRNASSLSTEPSPAANIRRNRMRKLDQWSKFHGELMNWSKEIADANVRVDFINHCVHKLIQTGNDKLANNNLLDDWSVEEEKQKVCKEWGQHIPSLVQEIRENKLKQLL
jgi:hypothetical protein